LRKRKRSPSFTKVCLSIKLTTKLADSVASVHIEDGEAGEATLLQLRAKLFALDKEAGWKERGVGTLKINVPKSCVSYDENGQPIPGSFDASGLEDEDADPNAPQVARLIMRQENTHRVVLNTMIVRAMEFKPKSGSSSGQLMFTAFEGDKELKPINMLLKVRSPWSPGMYQLTTARCRNQMASFSKKRLNPFNMSFKLSLT
jgi:hypothetical protein